MSQKCKVYWISKEDITERDLEDVQSFYGEGTEIVKIDPAVIGEEVNGFSKFCHDHADDYIMLDPAVGNVAQIVMATKKRYSFRLNQPSIPVMLGVLCATGEIYELP